MQRVVVGTAAFREVGFVADLAARWPGRVAVDIAAGADGNVTVQGWTEVVGEDALNALKRFRDFGVAAFVVTSVVADGTLVGPDLRLVEAAVGEAGGIPVLASGGVGSPRRPSPPDRNGLLGRRRRAGAVRRTVHCRRGGRGVRVIRVIPCLDVDAGRVVKGVNFVGLRDAGDPAELAARYDAEGADEVVFLDITASSDKRDTLVDVVRRTAEQVFIPLTVGGGVRRIEDARALLRAGAEKVSTNTAAVERPELVP